MPGLLGQRGVRAQVPPLAVHRHQVARLGHVEQRAQLAGRGVPGDVHPRGLLVHHGRAEPGQAVDHLVDGGLVAGHQRRREDDGVAGLDGDLVVLAAGHAAQRRQRLALRPGAETSTTCSGGIAAASSRETISPGATRSRPRSRATPMLRTIDRPTSATLRLVRLGAVEHLLDAVHVAGEAGDDQPLGGPREDVVEDRADAALGGDEAGHLGVGGVRQQQVDAARRRAGRRRPGR